MGDIRIASSTTPCGHNWSEDVTFIIRRLLSGGDHSSRGVYQSRGDQSGQGLVEYALILALIAVLSIIALTFLGGSINTLLSSIGNAL